MTLPSDRAAVVFDFDGTLVDSTAGLLAATNRLLVEERRRPLTLIEMRPMLGGGASRLLARAFRLTGEPVSDLEVAVRRWRAHYDRHAPECTRLFPGVVSLLWALTARGFALGICTGKPVSSTLKLLDVLGIRHFFGSVQGKESTPTPKPHPGHLLSVLAELGIAPEFAAMVGDSEHDVSMARAARVRSVLLTHGDADVPRTSLPADRIVNGPAELSRALEDLLRGRSAEPFKRSYPAH